MSSLLDCCIETNRSSNNGDDMTIADCFDPIPCRLPIDEKRKSIENLEDDSEGNHSLSRCELCKLKGRGDNDSLDRLQKILDTQSEFIPQDELHTLVANRFNETCYRYDQELPDRQRIGIKKITKGSVRRHYHAIQHLPEGEMYMLNERIEYLLDSIANFEQDKLYRKTSDGSILPNSDGWRLYKEINNILANFIILRHKCKSIKSSNPNNNRTSINNNKIHSQEKLRRVF